MYPNEIFLNSHFDFIERGKERMVFAYVRVSSKDQNIDRQIQAIKAYRPDIEEDNIFMDKKSGKTFERPQYELMKQIIARAAKAANGANGAEPVELVIEEFDRLGRNKSLVKEELAWFKEKGIIVRILNLPTTLIDLTGDTRGLLEMVQNILIEVLGTIAETELQFREKRQKEGIAVAKEKGVYKGRKPIEVDGKLFEEIYTRWQSNQLKATEAMALLNLKPNTFYRRVRQYEDTHYIDLCSAPSISQ